jgi:hypothetical protein
MTFRKLNCLRNVVFFLNYRTMDNVQNFDSYAYDMSLCECVTFCVLSQRLDQPADFLNDWFGEHDVRSSVSSIN